MLWCPWNSITFYMVIIKAVTQLFFLRIPCNIHFQEESSRTGLQTAQCKSNLQSPFISLLDCCKPQGPSIPVWYLPQDYRKKPKVMVTSSVLCSSGVVQSHVYPVTCEVFPLCNCRGMVLFKSLKVSKFKLSVSGNSENRCSQGSVLYI